MIHNEGGSGLNSCGNDEGKTTQTQRQMLFKLPVAELRMTLEMISLIGLSSSGKQEM
jgi:hypothetical protein